MASQLSPSRRRLDELRNAASNVSLDKEVRQRAPRGTQKAVDLCFVFDTTGSMSDKIEGLVQCMVDFVGALDRLELDWRISVLPFGDLTVPGDRVLTDLPFVHTQEEAEHMLRHLPRNSGGANEGESSLEAMKGALSKAYRNDAVQLLVLLTDEPALTVNLQPSLIDRELVAANVVVFSVTPYIDYYKQWAMSTGGSWLPISSTVDMTSLLSMLRSLAQKVARVAHDVHALGAGSVQAYLALNSGGNAESQ